MSYPVGPQTTPVVMVSHDSRDKGRDDHHTEAADYHEDRAAGSTHDEQAEYHNERAQWHRDQVEGDTKCKPVAYHSQDTRLARSTIRLSQLCKSKFGQTAGNTFFLNLHALLKASQELENPDSLASFLLELMSKPRIR